MSADTADVLPADTTDVSSAGAAENLPGDTAGLCVQATAEENDNPTFDCPELFYWTAPRLTEELTAHGGEDACSPQVASPFTTGSISARHKASLLSTEHNVLYPRSAICCVHHHRGCKIRSSQNLPFTKENHKMTPSLQNGKPLSTERWVWKLRVPR